MAAVFRPEGEPAWRYDTSCRGIVTSHDVPAILEELCAEMTLKQLAQDLNSSWDYLRRIHQGVTPMGVKIGKRLIDFLEAHDAKKKEAAPAATGTASQESDENGESSSPEIVPHHREETQTMNANAALGRIETLKAQLQEQTAEAERLRALLKTRDDTVDDLTAQTEKLSKQLAEKDSPESDELVCARMQIANLNARLSMAETRERDLLRDYYHAARRIISRLPDTEA